MGVKLKEIITRKEAEFQKLAGKIIAVDAPNIIMSLFNFSRKNPDEFTLMKSPKRHRIGRFLETMTRINTEFI